MKKLAWSFSALSVFKSCRKKFWHLRIQKDFKDGDSEAAAEGKEVHDAMHKRVLRDVPLPLPLRQYEKVAARFSAAKYDQMHGEMKLCLNEKLEPTDWFAKDAWVRVVIDLLIVKGKKAILVDWKTGRRKDEFDQLELSAAVLSRYMPEIEEFELVFVWLRDQEITPPAKLTKTDMKSVWLKFLPQVNEIEEARKTTEFPASPSGLCGWCPVTSCPHWYDRSDR